MYLHRTCSDEPRSQPMAEIRKLPVTVLSETNDDPFLDLSLFLSRSELFQSFMSDHLAWNDRPP